MKAQWNRTTLPTEADADEFGSILVMYATGPKAVHHWEEYLEMAMEEDGSIDAWMPLPETDFVWVPDEDEEDPTSEEMK